MSFWALLLSFAPWIALKIVTHLPLGDPVTTLKIGITTAAIISLYQARKDKTRGVIFWGTSIFFALTFVFVVLASNMWFIEHMGVLAQANLAGITIGSMLFKRPFTLDYAKQHVPQQFWTNPKFLFKNYVITGVWGLVFVIGLVTSLMRLYEVDVNELYLEFLDNAAMIGAMLFTDIYSKKRSIPVPAES